MEWRWVKSLLIVAFIILNSFLGYQVYQRNVVSLANSDTIESVNLILSGRNIKCDFDLTQTEVKKYMRRLNISNEKNIEEKFINLFDLNKSYKDYTGRNRKVISLEAIIATFIRETKLEDITIKSISLGYYPEISQIDKNILSGEAIPAWRIILDTDEEFIYNAYLGDKMN